MLNMLNKSSIFICCADNFIAVLYIGVNQVLKDRSVTRDVTQHLVLNCHWHNAKTVLWHYMKLSYLPSI